MGNRHWGKDGALRRPASYAVFPREGPFHLSNFPDAFFFPDPSRHGGAQPIVRHNVVLTWARIS